MKKREARLASLSSRIPENSSDRAKGDSETLAERPPRADSHHDTSDKVVLPNLPTAKDSTFSAGFRIGPYEFIRRLGQGGMGVVYLARDLRLGRLTAIKLLTRSRPDMAEHFLVEARATARCNHENIVTIHEVGEHEGLPYMVFEYLEGQTLRTWLKEYRGETGHPVPPRRAIQLMLPVVRALEYAHARGIVHCDLKPANIMLTTAGTTKVLDFGIDRHRFDSSQQMFP